MLNMYRIDVNIFLYLLNFPPRPHYFPVLEPSLANGGLQSPGEGSGAEPQLNLYTGFKTF